MRYFVRFAGPSEAYVLDCGEADSLAELAPKLAQAEVTLRGAFRTSLCVGKVTVLTLRYDTSAAATNNYIEAAFHLEEGRGTDE